MQESPFTGHPDFALVDMGTGAERRKRLVELYATDRANHGTTLATLECVTVEVLKQVIAECAATSMGADDPDAADVGWALAESLTRDARLNLRLVQLLGDAADLCAMAHDGKPLPGEFVA